MVLLRPLVVYLEEVIAGALLVLMTVTTIANVIARYCFNSPLSWAEELARYTFIWVVFLGAAVCTKQGRHIVIDGLMLSLPERLRAGILAGVDVLTIATMAALVYYGWVLTLFTTQPTSTLKVPMSVVYVVVPLSALSIALRTLPVLAAHLRVAVKGGGRQ